jgi:hypothetical protein
VKRKIKHDKYLHDLIEQIKSDYDSIYVNVPIYSRKRRRNRKRKVAEIDILAIHGDIWDVFEVKCSYRKTKAKKQLHRIRKLLPNIENTFFFCGESNTLEAIV